MTKFVSAVAAPLLLLGLAVGSGEAQAAGVDNLYQVATITTGKGEANRAVAFGRLLAAVLVKVSGDQRLATDPSVSQLANDAASFVDTFTYHDRMAGIPVHDEQGTYDRPYDLTADFNAGKIDALLRSLGREPWPLPRPRLVLFVGVRNGAIRSSAPSRDGDRDPGMRDALAAAAEQAGLHAAFASQAALAKTGARFETLPRRPVRPRRRSQSRRRRRCRCRHPRLQRGGGELGRRNGECNGTA